MIKQCSLGSNSGFKVPCFSSPSKRTYVIKNRHNQPVSCTASRANNETDRRGVLATVAAALFLSSPCPTVLAKTASRTAGDFCPPASTEGYVVYTPDARATPAIRAGVITPKFYSFQLPPSWSEGTILNILSGNFCMPRCDEPWYESLWESPEEGTATLIVSPLYRLVAKANATLKDLGPPERVIESIGPFITGNYLDSVEDVVSMGTETFSDGATFYTYDVVAPYAKAGTHQLAAFTVKGDLAYLWVLSANDKQWAKSESKLRYMRSTLVL